MMYEDIRSQAYEYKVVVGKQIETISHQTEEILKLTKERNDGIDKSNKLHKNLERLR